MVLRRPSLPRQCGVRARAARVRQAQAGRSRARSRFRPGHAGAAASPFAGEVVAIDPEPAMLDEERRRCLAEGVTNVTFVRGSSRNLDLVGHAVPFQLVTIGMAFHWMHPTGRAPASPRHPRGCGTRRRRAGEPARRAVATAGVVAGPGHAARAPPHGHGGCRASGQIGRRFHCFVTYTGSRSSTATPCQAGRRGVRTASAEASSSAIQSDGPRVMRISTRRSMSRTQYSSAPRRK